MSRLFLEDGDSIAVTAVSVCGNFIADIKTHEKNGYDSIVVSKTKKSNNCLLYTSPSPRDRTRCRMPSSA